MHDAEPHEKQKIVGFLSTLKEPVGGNREKGTERKKNSKRKEESMLKDNVIQDKWQKLNFLEQLNHGICQQTLFLKAM